MHADAKYKSYRMHPTRHRSYLQDDMHNGGSEFCDCVLGTRVVSHQPQLFKQLHVLKVCNEQRMNSYTTIQSFRADVSLFVRYFIMSCSFLVRDITCVLEFGGA